MIVDQKGYMLVCGTEVYTAEHALDVLIERYEMTKARHLLTIDTYDREYRQMREAIIYAIRSPRKQIIVI